jgi:Lipopolysaccharide-assembly
VSRARTGFGARSARAHWAALAVALASFAAGCGYSTGLSVGDRQRSIGIEVFGNDSLERDLERPLYDQMSRAIRDWSESPLVAPDRADMIVRGKITAYHRRSGIRNPNNQLLETAVFVDVEASLYHAGSETPTRGPVHATSAVGYIIGPAQNEQDARDRALKNIADKLVLDLLTPLN